MNLYQQLTRLKKTQLIKLIKDLAQLDPAIEALIKASLEPEDAPEQPDSLFNENEGDWVRAEFEFWRRQASTEAPRPIREKDLNPMYGILGVISKLLENDQIPLGFELIEEYLQLQKELFDHFDDSDGLMGDVFHEATELWLDAAADLRAIQPEACNWSTKVKQLYDQNDYGCQDQLLPNANQLLTQDELQQLAWHYEKEQRSALKAPHPDDELYNSKAAHAQLGLHGIGIALEDFSLIEKSLLLSSPKPNDLELIALAQSGIGLQAWDRVEHWLQPKFWSNDHQRREMERAYREEKGDQQGALELAWQNYQANPFAFLLIQWWEEATAKERTAKQPLINKHVREHQFLREAVDLAIISGNYPLAAEVLIQQEKELDGLEYGKVLSWRDIFEQEKLWLATALCYRMLIEDILNNGRTKGYPSAARYLQQEQALSKRIKRYQSHPNTNAYLSHLKKQHGRKKSFWKHVPELQ